MKLKSLFLMLCVILTSLLKVTYGQVGINNDASNADPSSMLDVKSITKGVLISRMTATQRGAISQPATGLMIFCSDDGHFYVNKGTPASPSWKVLSTQWTTSGNDINYTLGNVSIGTTSYYGKLSADGGGSFAGVYGQSDASHYGYLGHFSYGVSGYNYSSTAGHAGVLGYSGGGLATPGVIGNSNVTGSGTTYDPDHTANGVVGFTSVGQAYQFGVFGSRYDGTYGPSAGVIGSVSMYDAAKPWGALGFQDASLNEFAGHFNGNINITGGIKDGSGYGTAGSVLVTNGSNDVYWSSNAGTTGSGTTNYISKWSGATTLTNSVIYENASNVSIGTTSSTCKLNVDGGGSVVAIYGKYDNTNFGYLGHSNYGVAGYNYSSTPGYAGVLGYSLSGIATPGVIGNNYVNGNGTAYDPDHTANGVVGISSLGMSYQFGVFGSRYDGTYGPSAGVIGSVSMYDAAKPWGALGFQDAALNEFAGHFNGNINIIGGIKDGSGYGTAGSVLVTNGSNDVYWSSNAGTTGSGTTNYISKWSGATTLINSVIYEGSSNIGIGTTTVSQGRLAVNGGGTITAVWGQFNDDIRGSLGTSNNGVEGYHFTTGGTAGSFYHGGSPASYTAQWAIDGVMTNSTINSGSSYAYGNYGSGGIRGSNYNGSNYTFAVGGWNYNDINRCGGTIGSDWFGNYWGALGYKTSGSITYGGYFTSYYAGTGRSSDSDNAEGIGIGAWGDLMGADIHGGVYGLYVEGDNFSIYSSGPIISDQPSVQLQDVGERERAVTYSSSSTEATVSVAGQGTLVNGQGTIIFDDNFIKVISARIPVIITVTPLGPTNGVYISSSNEAGFIVAENNGGSSNVSFYYMAVGRRAGYENPKLPAEVVSSDFASKMTEGLHNDADITTDGKGLYYRGDMLYSGKSSSMMKPVKQ
jgi:hypothetical protein